MKRFWLASLLLLSFSLAWAEGSDKSSFAVRVVTKLADRSSFSEDYRFVQNTLGTTCSVVKHTEASPGAVNITFDCPLSSGLGRVSVYSISEPNGTNLMMFVEAILRPGSYEEIRKSIRQKLGAPSSDRKGYTRWVLDSFGPLAENGTPIISLKLDRATGGAVFLLGREQGP